MGQELIINALGRGSQNAIHMTTLANEWGCSITSVKKIIRDARMQGAEICSGVEGYWIAADEAEKNIFLKRLNRQAFERIKTARAIKNTSNDIEGQISLNFERMGVSNQ